jgi:hypothetical protein
MCLFAFVLLGWIAPIHAQSEMTEQRLEQIRFDGTPNVNGYTVFFPVLNTGVQAAEMKFDVYRIQWNNWIARDPWFLE